MLFRLLNEGVTVFLSLSIDAFIGIGWREPIKGVASISDECSDLFAIVVNRKSSRSEKRLSFFIFSFIFLVAGRMVGSKLLSSTNSAMKEQSDFSEENVSLCGQVIELIIVIL